MLHLSRFLLLDQTFMSSYSIPCGINHNSTEGCLCFLRPPVPKLYGEEFKPIVKQPAITEIFLASQAFSIIPFFGRG
jgi:hypothetical protein